MTDKIFEEWTTNLEERAALRSNRHEHDEDLSVDENLSPESLGGKFQKVREVLAGTAGTDRANDQTETV